MVKPGVYTINKKELKNGDKTTEYVHVEVQPLPPKYDTVVRERKGCTGMRLLGVFLFLLVIVGIAVGITYAVRWEEGFKAEMPEGGDVIYDRPDDDYEWEDGKSRPGDHDGHHGDHPGDHDGHHGDHPGHHDGHHGDHPIDPTGDGRPDDGDHGRPEPTERTPPIDYIGTRPPLIGRPEDGHDDHGDDDDTDDTSEDHDGRPHPGDDGDTNDTSEDHDGRPHHGDDDDTDDTSEDHDGRPHHGGDDDTDDSSEDHDGRPHHGNDDGEDDDDDKINHRNMNNPPFRSINQWKSERAGERKWSLSVDQFGHALPIREEVESRLKRPDTVTTADIAGNSIVNVPRRVW